MDYKELIAIVSKETIINEEFELKNIASKGIFYMPEIAFAYQVGKNIMKAPTAIAEGWIWDRETTLQGYDGIADIVISLPNNHKIIVEFKMVDKIGKYEADIWRLRDTAGDYTKTFCVLIDTFSSNQEEMNA